MYGQVFKNAFNLTKLNYLYRFFTKSLPFKTKNHFLVLLLFRCKVYFFNAIALYLYL